MIQQNGCPLDLMNRKFLVTGRSLSGKSSFIKEAEGYMVSSNTLKIAWVFEEIPLSAFLKQSYMNNSNNTVIIIECSPLISSFREKNSLDKVIDLNQHQVNDQIIKYLQQLNNTFTIQNNSSFEEFRVSVKKNIKSFLKNL